MKIEDAIKNLRNGIPMRRETWFEKAHIMMVENNPTEKITIQTPVGTNQDWYVSVGDILASDWEVFQQ